MSKKSKENNTMPCIDMPLEKLKKYEGRNPCPADFDLFWDESLKELSEIDPNASFEPFVFPSKICRLL